MQRHRFILKAMAALAVCLSSFMNLSAYDFEVDGIYYNIIYGHFVEVTYMRSEYSGYHGDVVIPAIVVNDSTNYLVNRIGDQAFAAAYNLTSVHIPNSVESIGDAAFYMCKKLKDINFADNLTKIGEQAFRYCESLTDINLEHISTIGPYAFSYCSGLKTVTFGTPLYRIGKYAFDECNSLERVNCATSTPVYTEDELFSSYAYENALLYIPHGALWDYQHATSWRNFKHMMERGYNYVYDGIYYITEPYNRTAIVSFRDPFLNSYSGEVNIPATIIRNDYVYNVIAIGDSAFYGSTDLTAVTIPSSAKTIGMDAFRGCSSLTSVNIPAGVESIGNTAFTYCTGLTTVKLPNTLTTIGDLAFSCCVVLKDIVIPNSVTQLGESAFDTCLGLERAVIGNGLTTINNGVFHNCEKLTQVSIGSGVNTIASEAFSFCTSLPCVTIPANVTTIEADAFLQCNALNRVICWAETPPTIQYNTFEGDTYQNAELVVLHEVEDTYFHTENWQNFDKITGVVLGDFDGDRDITITDVTILIDILLSGHKVPVNADINGDGIVTIADVTTLIDKLLGEDSTQDN